MFRFCVTTIFFFFCSNPVLPQSFLEAPKKNHKRHPIHKKKGSGTPAGEYILPSVYQADEEELGEIPPDVQKVLEEIDLEDEAPDENTLEVLEDIWLKAGEMGRSKYASLSECIMTLTVRWPLLHTVFSFQENNYAEHVIRQYHHLSGSESSNNSHLIFWCIRYVQYESLCNGRKYCG